MNHLPAFFHCLQLARPCSFNPHSVRGNCQYEDTGNWQIMLIWGSLLGSTGWSVLRSMWCVMCFPWHSLFCLLLCDLQAMLCVCIYRWVCVVCLVYLNKVKAARAQSAAACCQVFLHSTWQNINRADAFISGGFPFKHKTDRRPYSCFL